MSDQTSTRTRVVIAGAGVAGLEAALALRELAWDRVDVTLLAPESHFTYRPAAVAEPFGLGETRHFDLPEIAAAAGASLMTGALVFVDTDRHEAVTATGAVVPYDILLLCLGAVPAIGVPGAITFRGPGDIAPVSDLLSEITAGEVESVVFAVPWGATWALPLYELALMTAAWLRARGHEGTELTLVTPEAFPLELFGTDASKTVQQLLDDSGIAVRPRSFPSEAHEGELALFRDAPISTDRVLSLPRLQGQPIGGIPQTIEGFIPVDAHGRVNGADDVFAAGDVTDFPVKQGGIAAQQAVVAAQAIASAAGADIEPRPFTPVLRGMLLTGGRPHYLRRDMTSEEDFSWASESPIWWPPAKIVGRYLAPFLANLAGLPMPVGELASPEGLEVDVELEPSVASSVRRPPAVAPPAEPPPLTTGDLMSTEPLIVAPEDTLGEVAELMSQRDVASALVAEYGKLVGILTARDLLHAVAARIHTSEARVRQWMTVDPVTIGVDSAPADAAALMAEYRIHHLPVVDGERPVGMVGFRDVALEAPPRVAQPAG